VSGDRRYARLPGGALGWRSTLGVTKWCVDRIRNPVRAGGRRCLARHRAGPVAAGRGRVRSGAARRVPPRCAFPGPARASMPAPSLSVEIQAWVARGPAAIGRWD